MSTSCLPCNTPRVESLLRAVRDSFSSFQVRRRAPPSHPAGVLVRPDPDTICGQPPTICAIISTTSQIGARSSQAVGTYDPQGFATTVGAMQRDKIEQLRRPTPGDRRRHTQLRERAMIDDDRRRAARLLIEFEHQAAEIENDHARTDAA